MWQGFADGRFAIAIESAPTSTPSGENSSDNKNNNRCTDTATTGNRQEKPQAPVLMLLLSLNSYHGNKEQNRSTSDALPLKCARRDAADFFQCDPTTPTVSPSSSIALKK